MHRALHLLSLPSQGSSLEAPGQVGTGPQGAHFAGNHGDKGFIWSPAPHPGNVTVQVANSGAAHATRTSGPHGAGCARRGHCACPCAQDVACAVGTARAHVPRRWPAPCALHVRPGRGSPDVHCACAMHSGGGGVEGKVLEDVRTEWDFSKPLRKETRREGNYVCCQKLCSLHQVHTRASEAGTPSTNNSQLERPS